MTRAHTLPWRLGSKLHESFHGLVTIYDGTPNGDGGRHGRFVAVAATQAIGSAIVDAVNDRSQTPDPPPDLQAIVQAQAEDPALWFVAGTATEAYLQAALRELHAAVEAV
jgi:hypothetical protein